MSLKVPISWKVRDDIGVPDYIRTLSVLSEHGDTLTIEIHPRGPHSALLIPQLAEYFKFFVLDRIKGNYSSITSGFSNNNSTGAIADIKNNITKMVQSRVGMSEIANKDVCSGMQSIMNQSSDPSVQGKLKKNLGMLNNFVDCGNKKTTVNITPEQIEKAQAAKFVNSNSVKMCSILGKKFIPSIIKEKYKWDDNLLNGDSIFNETPLEIKEYIAKYKGSRILSIDKNGDYNRIEYVCSFDIKENKIIDIVIVKE